MASAFQTARRRPSAHGPPFGVGGSSITLLGPRRLRGRADPWLRDQPGGGQPASARGATFQ